MDLPAGAMAGEMLCAGASRKLSAICCPGVVSLTTGVRLVVATSCTAALESDTADALLAMALSGSGGSSWGTERGCSDAG